MRRRGTGDYVNSGNYDWQFYPNIYRFIATSAGPGGVTPDYASASSMGLTTRALGGLGQDSSMFTPSDIGTGAGFVVGIVVLVGGALWLMNQVKPRSGRGSIGL